MKTFKQYLTESRSAPLYHATSEFRVQGILKNGFKPWTHHKSSKLLMPGGDDKVPGVSATRSFKFAMNWGAVIFELEQREITQRYKIIPIQFFTDDDLAATRPNRARVKDYSGHDNEYEEFIVTSKPLPPKYIKRIWVKEHITRGKFAGMKDVFDPIRQKYGADFIKTF